MIWWKGHWASHQRLWISKLDVPQNHLNNSLKDHIYWRIINSRLLASIMIIVIPMAVNKPSLEIISSTIIPGCRTEPPFNSLVMLVPSSHHILRSLVNGECFGFPQDNSLMGFMAPHNISLIVCLHSWAFKILSSTICQGNSGISTSYDMRCIFLQVSETY